MLLYLLPKFFACFSFQEIPYYLNKLNDTEKTNMFDPFKNVMNEAKEQFILGYLYR
jgi:hypothetical protein